MCKIGWKVVVYGVVMRLNGKKVRIASSMTICAPVFMFYVTDIFLHRKTTDMYVYLRPPSILGKYERKDEKDARKWW